MPSFVCKRYRRSAPGAATGTLTDEWSFPASTAMEAQTKVRHMLLSGIAPMDWKKDFAVLDDACGHELAVWHHGAANA